MSAPSPSFVVIPDAKTKSGYKVYHLLSGDVIHNSHTTICQHHGINEDKVLKVEMWAKHLKAGTCPTPWGIDRLPLKYKYTDDLPKGFLDAAEYAAQRLMTPDNFYAYICSNVKDALQILDHVFNAPYVTEYKAIAKRNGAQDGYRINPVYLLAALHQQQVPSDKRTSTIRQANQTPKMIAPKFYLEDVLNPAIWLELPLPKPKGA